MAKETEGPSKNKPIRTPPRRDVPRPGKRENFNDEAPPRDYAPPERTGAEALGARKRLTCDKRRETSCTIAIVAPATIRTGALSSTGATVG